MAIEWYDYEVLDGEQPEDHECRCDTGLDDCTMSIDEGQASITHNGCGKSLWIYQEDIFLEDIPVKVNIEPECSSPGGWHGMHLCDHGYIVEIDVDTDKL